MKQDRTQSQKTITRGVVFVHLVHEYRCLANAAYAWKRFGDPKSNDSEKGCANKLIPEVGTVIRNSLHLHTRSLIGFYWPNQPNLTDLNSSHFVTPDPSKYSDLIALKRPIEVHELHVTSWRDRQYRQSGPTNVQRPDFDEVDSKIFGWLAKALRELITNTTPPWDKALQQLHKASEERFDKGASYDWPKDLGEKEDIENYLNVLQAS